MNIHLWVAAAILALAACSDSPGRAPNDADTSPADMGDMFAGDAGDVADQDRMRDQGSGRDQDLPGDLGPQQDLASGGDPITAPNETWTWVGFDDAVCGNGQPTGIGVNLTDRGDDVFVFLMGGGACWDVNSCFVLNAAANIESGYDQTRFDNEGVLGASAFDRDNADNPLRDLNWVFVPYCTGDLHAGDKVTTYMALGQTRQVHHVGSANIRRFLARLTPTFENAERVFVSGSSAGGYGAQLNFHLFEAAFDGAEVHALSDSGPLVQPYGRIGAWNQAWTLQTPPGCADCATSFPAWYDHLVNSYPTSRFGLLTYDADQTIHAYFGYPAGNSFTQALTVFMDEHIAPAQNAEVFALTGTQHVLLGGLTGLAAPDGTTLAGWTRAWMEGDADWTTVRP